MRLINADELLEWIGREELDTREKIANLVNRMPTQTVQATPSAKWVILENHTLMHNVRCMRCGNSPIKRFIPERKGWNWAFTDYCPSCGADMRGEKQMTDAERNAEIKVDEAISRTIEKIIKLLGKPVCYSINLEVDGIGYEIKIERCEEHRWD